MVVLMTDDDWWHRFGRKKTVLCFFGVKIIGILLCWFGASYVSFVVGRLLVGCGQVGFFISGFVLGMYSIDWSVYSRSLSQLSVGLFWTFANFFFESFPFVEIIMAATAIMFYCRHLDLFFRRRLISGGRLADRRQTLGLPRVRLWSRCLKSR